MTKRSEQKNRDADGKAEMEEAVQRLNELDNAVGFLHVRENCQWGEFWSTWRGNRPWEKPKLKKKIVVLWNTPSVDPLAVLSWRSGLTEVDDLNYRFLAVPKALPGGQTCQEWLKQEIGDWSETVEREKSAFEVGHYVSCKGLRHAGQAGGHDPAFLTINPSGKLAPILNKLDECKRRFRAAIHGDVGVRRENVLEHVQNLVAFSGRGFEGSANSFRKETDRLQRSVDAALQREKFSAVDRRSLPRVLLLGPSGSGKTLIAKYLAWRTSPGKGEKLFRPFQKVAMPAYLHKEGNFEYDVFGYCAGSYTDASPLGSLGILLSIMGGVVFFDEIGDASPEIQAKLLTYLDDYMVTPKGWSGAPIYCPTLVVAATNRPIDQWASESDLTHEPSDSRYFRNDLWQRFDVVLRIPSLEDRKAELPFILDAMLQDQAFNPDGVIKDIGEGALNQLMTCDFTRGNFRTLEGVVREACTSARLGQRDYLVVGDVPMDGDEAHIPG